MPKEFHPLSLCTCGHVGDGPESQHEPRFEIGHGPCLVRGCKCEQFTWTRYLTATEVFTFKAIGLAPGQPRKGKR